MLKYTFVLFDLDDTLRFLRPGYRELVAQILEELGFPQPQEKMRALWRWSHEQWQAHSDLHRKRRALGNDPEKLKEFWLHWNELLLEFLGIPESVRHALAHELDRRLERRLRHSVDYVPPEVYMLLRLLREAGARMAVVTNRHAQVEQEYLDRLGLTPFFNTVVSGSQIGEWKPHPKIFHAAMERLGAIPEQTVHIGDNYYSDIIGAHNAGIQAILFDVHDLFPHVDTPRVRDHYQLRSLLFQRATVPI